MPPEYKYAPQILKKKKKKYFILFFKKISSPWLFSIAPFFSSYIYIFVLFHPWTALLCYDCISYEGSVNGTGSDPYGRKDSKSLTGTNGGGTGDCLLFFSFSFFLLFFLYDVFRAFWNWCLNLWVALYFLEMLFKITSLFYSLLAMSRFD